MTFPTVSKLGRDSSNENFQWTISPNESNYCAALEVILHWSSLPELVDFACNRHGYENQDGYFGVTYPSDLDEFDIGQGESIPLDHVEVYAGFGDPHSPCFILRESVYLEILRQVLQLSAFADLAERVKEQITSLSPH